MTLVALTNLTGRDLHVHCDTLATRSGTGYVPPRYTSVGTVMRSTSLEEGYETYHESACKIGAFSDQLACAVAGREDLILDVLMALESTLRAPPDFGNIATGFHAALAAVNASGRPKAGSATLLLAIRLEDGIHCAKLQTAYDAAGQLVPVAMERGPIAGRQPCFWLDGTGATLAKGLTAEGVSKALEEDPTLDPILVSMLSQHYSDKIRSLTRLNKTVRGVSVRGVGGAVLGLRLTERGVEYPPDCIFIGRR